MKLAPAPVAAYRSAAEHLADELAWLDLLLARHVAFLRATGQFNEDPMRGLYITDAEVSARIGQPPEPPRDHDHRIASKRAVIDARLAESVELPIPSLVRRFGLDAFESACVLMAAAPSIDPRYEILFAYAHNDVSRKLPSTGLALALLAESPEERLRLLCCFSAQSNLLRSDLVRFPAAEAGKALTSRSMAVDERVVFALIGQDCGHDARVASFTSKVCEPLVPWRRDALVEQAEAALNCGDAVAIHLDGQPDCGQRQLAYAASNNLGLNLIEADLSSPAAALLAPQDLGRLLAREAMIGEAALLVSARDAVADRRHETAIAAAIRAGASVFIAASPDVVAMPDIARSVRLVDIAMPLPTALQRANWWRAALDAGKMHDPALTARLGLALRCGPDAISAIARAATASGGAADFQAIAAIARRAARSQVPALARLVRPHWRWDDLVLPEKHTQRLRDICAELEHGPRVLNDWSFSQKAASQNGVVLFSGASGTGKTMAASLIAASIGLDLYRVDLASMFNKYIGETEKNLDRMFAAMEATNAVVFFDEADVLFGKRTEVKDAHDRYANLSVAYLLQRIEIYDGLVILATNLAGNMDDAFSRRLRHIVHFPLPDARMRRRLWDFALPQQAPRGADLDLDQLAQRFDLTGGNIRNVALAAAYLAAAEDKPIGQRHALQAVARELEKLGRPPTRDDFGSAYGMLSPTEGG